MEKLQILKERLEAFLPWSLRELECLGGFWQQVKYYGLQGRHWNNI